MLLEALPEEFVGGVFAGQDAAFAVFHGDEIEAMVALELEPADVIGAAAAGNEIVFQVVGDGAGLGIDSVSAEIGRIAFKSGGFFFGCGGGENPCETGETRCASFLGRVCAHTACPVAYL